MMTLADALEDERRETVKAEMPSGGRRASASALHTPDKQRPDSLRSPTQRSSKERRSSFVNKERLGIMQSPSGKHPRKQSASADAMAAIFGGTSKELQNSSRSKPVVRHHSIAETGQHSKHPRSPSPVYGLLDSDRSSPVHLITDVGDFDVKDDGSIRGRSDVNGDVAERWSPISYSRKVKPSDNLAKDGAGHDRQASSDSRSNLRLQKDKPIRRDEAGEESESSEDEEDDAKSSDEEEEEQDSKPGQKRGRRRLRAAKNLNVSEAGSGDSDGDDYSSLHGQNKSTERAKRILAAAEEDRMTRLKAKRGSSEPVISMTGPGGEKLAPKKGGVHPNTSYDYAVSGASSTNTSDADVSDIKGAQRLSINMSHLDTSVPNRVIRTILRGDFSTLQEGGEEGLRRSRLYLVATDLSDEAVYALEWTIGTILRDGDTMIAIYAVDEETGTGKSIDTDGSSGVQIGDGVKTARDTIKAMSSQTEKMNQNSQTPPLLTSSSYIPATLTDSRPGSVDSRLFSKAEIEGQRAIEDISSTCVRLLRKTKLQVRVSIEVIHCKSPKHLITEAIDGLEPTLVVLGSRGRSALKGVLLGSFSNYLVTKSSVPVMVARKKLRKHAKFKKTNFRLSNNLQRPNRLISAKID